MLNENLKMGADLVPEFTKYLGQRRLSRAVFVGGLQMGGGAKPLIQSMNNTDTRDVEGTLAQIHALEEAGCHVTRVAVPDQLAALALAEITKRSPLPVVADIHFDYRLALQAIKSGAAKIRINPGNIGGPAKLREVVEACKSKSIPIRVGVNAGSLSKEKRLKYGGVTVEALCESAMESIQLIEELNYEEIVLSLKASDPALTIACYRRLAELCPYPLHLGVTEAGTALAGGLRSAVGIGTLLAEGIGDTLRVSLTADPVEEVEAAKHILSALHLGEQGLTLVSCPTCGRTRVNLIALAGEVEQRLKRIQSPLTVAVMGCEVNGPGEAREADIGIAGGKGEYILFSKGKIVRRLPESEALEALIQYIEEEFNIEVPR